MRKLLLAVTPVLAISAFAGPVITPANAGADAPVCATIYTLGGSEERCDFVNFSQCQATVQGLAGSCHGNPYYSSSFNQDRSGRRVR